MALIEKKNFLGRLSEKISDVIMTRGEVDEALLEEIEETLITSDIGVETVLDLMEYIREKVKDENITKPNIVKTILKKAMISKIDKEERQEMLEVYPLIILIIGTNGSGKTTNIGKLAQRYKKAGKTVLLAAADTFRAAAAEQLTLWSERAEVPIIKHQEGADPSAVIFDAIQSAKAKDIDVLICDTAGRLQTKKNLMAELEKMNKVIGREFPEAARETLLVLDATTGKNAVSQAEEFGKITDITGVVLTKLDGTAKGGIALTITNEFDIPIKFVGVGEKAEDLLDFNPEEYIGGIFDE
ncbi:MAG: signal recognition particle-docking protein FtsY [Anaerovoracaceae bacterium]